MFEEFIRRKIVVFLWCRLSNEAMIAGVFAGVFAVAQRQSESQISEANAGAKPAKYTSASL